GLAPAPRAGTDLPGGDQRDRHRRPLQQSKPFRRHAHMLRSAGEADVAECRADQLGAVNRHARWMRALRAKSGGMVEALMSSTRANSTNAASSSLKRRKLLLKYSTPPGASR